MPLPVPASTTISPGLTLFFIPLPHHPRPKKQTPPAALLCGGGSFYNEGRAPSLPARFHQDNRGYCRRDPDPLRRREARSLDESVPRQHKAGVNEQDDDSGDSERVVFIAKHYPEHSGGT